MKQPRSLRRAHELLRKQTLANKHQGRVGYLAPDGKAFMARIGAVSLPQSACILPYEQTYKCFTARCFSILQGRFAHAQGYIRAEDNNTSG
ncbi:hypothetical protein RYH73_05380 [Olivibacter sp. CPCC 100613]|uniref:hypothetical protein n=1 Tax=Olivibacter sp. CPCC 100613 TaxID=3079931 RepID=UPI002FF55A04